jgi:hypothetical protein
MAYGLTLDQVTSVNRPKKVVTAWGGFTPCTDRPEYSLTRIELTGMASAIRRTR